VQELRKLPKSMRRISAFSAGPTETEGRRYRLAPLPLSAGVDAGGDVMDRQFSAAGS
jgi:hypothetical protein